MNLELVDRRKEDLDVEDEHLRHVDGLHVERVADVREHLRDARRRALLECREHRPDARDLLLHLLLLLLERDGRLVELLVFVLAVGAREGWCGRARDAAGEARDELDVPELGRKKADC
jgi:hypothetical protein